MRPVLKVAAVVLGASTLLTVAVWLAAHIVDMDDLNVLGWAIVVVVAVWVGGKLLGDTE